MKVKQVLIDQYLDYFNNYLTIAKYAEDNDLALHQAQTVVSLGKQLHEKQFIEDHFQFIRVG
jgi:aromatic ring hydroxylase